MKSRVVLVVSQSKKLTQSENRSGNAKKMRNPSRLGDRKARPLSASSVARVEPKCLAAARDHMSRVASAAPTVKAIAPSASGRVSESPMDKIRPEGSALSTNQTLASPATLQPAVRRRCGPTAVGRLVNIWPLRSTQSSPTQMTPNGTNALYKPSPRSPRARKALKRCKVAAAATRVRR